MQQMGYQFLNIAIYIYISLCFMCMKLKKSLTYCFVNREGKFQ